MTFSKHKEKSLSVFRKAFVSSSIALTWQNRLGILFKHWPQQQLLLLLRLVTQLLARWC